LQQRPDEGQVRVVKNGGENNLHLIPAKTPFEYVISGAVKFYGEGDQAGRRI
jgi:hypothetical protein